MIPINDTIHLEDSELTWSFARAGGPGGQNVNKVASKAVLRWDLKANTSLPDDVKERLRRQQRRRLTNDDELIFTSQNSRDQERNRQDNLDKLREAILQALVVPRPRKATRPTRGSRARRLRAKRHRSAAKSLRRRPADE